MISTKVHGLWERMGETSFTVMLEACIGQAEESQGGGITSNPSTRIVIASHQGAVLMRGNLGLTCLFEVIRFKQSYFRGSLLTARGICGKLEEMTELNKVDYTKLFWLHDTFTKNIIRLDVQNEWVNIPKALALFNGKYNPQEPIIFRQFIGNRVADFLWSGLVPLVCVSKKVADLFSSHNFTGWSTYTAQVLDKKGNLLSGYSGLTITSDAGSQDLTKSQIIVKPPITPKGKPYDVYKGMYFNENKWDGSDIFRVQNGHIVITKAVRDVLLAEKVTNFGLVPLEEYEANVDSVSKNSQ